MLSIKIRYSSYYKVEGGGVPKKIRGRSVSGSKSHDFKQSANSYESSLFLFWKTQIYVDM